MEWAQSAPPKHRQRRPPALSGQCQDNALHARMVDDSDLLSPTLKHANAAMPPPGARPWRPGSTALVGFFGGAFAATWYALDNLARLGAADSDEARKVRLYGYTVAALFLVIQLVSIGYDPVAYREDHGKMVRLLGRLSGYGLGYYLSKMQAGAVRRWIARVDGSEESFDPAWRPGFLRALGYGSLSAIPAILLMLGLSL